MDLGIQSQNFCNSRRQLEFYVGTEPRRSSVEETRRFDQVFPDFAESGSDRQDLLGFLFRHPGAVNGSEGKVQRVYISVAVSGYHSKLCESPLEFILI